MAFIGLTVKPSFPQPEAALCYECCVLCVVEESVVPSVTTFFLSFCTQFGPHSICTGVRRVFARPGLTTSALHRVIIASARTQWIYRRLSAGAAA